MAVDHRAEENQGSVGVERAGAVAVITLHRERKLNALSTHMEERLLAALHSTEVSTSRAVVVTGGAKVFSAGADINEVTTLEPRDIVAYYRGSGSVYEVFAGLPQPTVVAVAGYCLGGGLELSLAADIRVADESAVFGFPEVTIGILPSSGGITRATRLLGYGRTADLVLRGRRFTAQEALQWGVLTELASPGRHLEIAMGIAEELAAHDPLVLSVTKQVLQASGDTTQSASLLLEQLAYAVLNRTSTDHAEPNHKEVDIPQ
jgi:enoyl-CoA hydratase/carnithine racemase